MTEVIRAVDVGYSWTKYVVEGASFGEIRCRAFPSIAPRASSRDLALDGRARRSTVQIAVDELAFEVGPDTALVQDTYQAMPRDDGYTDTP